MPTGDRRGRQRDNGARPVRQVERKPFRDRGAKLSCLFAAGLQIVHLNIDHAVECADLALCTPQRSDAAPPATISNALSVPSTGANVQSNSLP